MAASKIYNFNSVFDCMEQAKKDHAESMLPEVKLEDEEKARTVDLRYVRIEPF